eukprot:1090322-Pelagomonas_calceolata.AAC.2
MSVQMLLHLAIAKYLANQTNISLVDTGIPSARPGRIIISQIFWLAKGGNKRACYGHVHSSCILPNSPSFPISKMPSSHMHTNADLGVFSNKLKFLLPELDTTCNEKSSKPCKCLLEDALYLLTYDAQQPTILHKHIPYIQSMQSAPKVHYHVTSSPRV